MSYRKFKRGLLLWSVVFLALAALIGWGTARATVSTEATARVMYPGDGADVTFEITFPYNDTESTVFVVHLDSGMVETAWVNGSDYTVSNAGTYGTVVATTAPASGESLVIYRDTPMLQATDLRPNRRFSADTEESMFDKLTLMIQEGYETFTRSLHLPITADPDIDVELPTPVGNGLIGWASDGESLENKTDLTSETVTAWSRAWLALQNANEGRAELVLTATSEANAITMLSGATYPDGQMVVVLDTGNLYLFDEGNTKWIVRSGNAYATADLPTTTNFTIPDDIWVHDTTVGWPQFWTGAAWDDPGATTLRQGIIEIANTTEVTDGNDTVRAITPYRQGYHKSACKAWVNFTPIGGAGGTCTINASYNITGVNQDAVPGGFTVTIDDDMADANYVMTGNCLSSVANRVHHVQIIDGTTPAVGSFQVETRNDNAVLADPSNVYIMLFGN